MKELLIKPEILKKFLFSSLMLLSGKTISICDVANMPGDVTNYISVNDKGAPDIVTSLQLRLGMVAIGKSIPIFVGNVSSWEAHEIRTLYNAVK